MTNLFSYTALMKLQIIKNVTRVGTLFFLVMITSVLFGQKPVMDQKNYVPPVDAQQSRQIPQLNTMEWHHEEIPAGELAGRLHQHEMAMSCALQTYPNPARKVLNVRCLMAESQQISIALVDLSGKTRYSAKKSLDKGVNVIKINVEALPRALYLLSIEGKQSQNCKRVILQ